MIPYTGQRRCYLLVLVRQPSGFSAYASLDILEGTLEDALAEFFHPSDEVLIVATADELEVQS